MTEPRDQRAEPGAAADAPAAAAAGGDSAAAAAQPAAAEAAMPADEMPPLDPGDRALFGVIDRLAAILDHSDLVELEIQVGSTGLTLRKPVALGQVAVPVGPGVAAGAAAASGGGPGAGAGGLPGSAAGDAATPPAKPSVKAPLTGIWYASPAPGSAPYVQAGSEVAVGTVIGLIEAMKLFNEIKSDMAGRVTKVIAEQGKLVKAKQPLIEVEPL
jgi:acetyl-CoA carboxylase biotin carboxyl carrier protein